jgi:superfamily II DNA or RNA helicase
VAPVSILRPYQDQSITASWAAISPEVNRVAIEMATGLGKTITFAEQIDRWLETFEAAGNRALVLVHTDELTRQAVDKILTVTKGRWSVGVVKAGQDEVDADIVVGSVATLRNPERRERLTDVGLIIVDECHHAVTKSYVDILTHYGAMDGRIPVFGYTATLARSDGRGLGQVWQDLAFSRSLPWAIRKGWLIDLVPYTINIPGVDASSSAETLDAQLADSIAPEAVVDAWMAHAGVLQRTDLTGRYTDAPSTVLFAPLVKSAEAFRDAFSEAGVKAEVVHGAMHPAERQAVLERYEAGITTVVCNAMVLTEGWDSPRTMCVIVARPTQSVPLFVQMIGRGLRPWLDAQAPPREDQRCILLCVAGATTDIVTVADLSDKIEEVQEGKSFLAMEDELFDLGADIPQDEDNAYRGPVRVDQWDALVQRSSKAWKYTEAGVPFLPIAKRGLGYVFVVQHLDRAEVWARRAPVREAGKARVGKLATAADLELAMAVAEDEAQELGGDIGALLADKTRPWRKAVPSLEAISAARRAGVDEASIQKVLASKASGKAGKLSDLIDRVTASRVLDHNVQRIRERASA